MCVCGAGGRMGRQRSPTVSVMLVIMHRTLQHPALFAACKREQTKSFQNCEKSFCCLSHSDFLKDPSSGNFDQENHCKQGALSAQPPTPSPNGIHLLSIFLMWPRIYGVSSETSEINTAPLTPLKLCRWGMAHPHLIRAWARQRLRVTFVGGCNKKFLALQLALVWKGSLHP